MKSNRTTTSYPNQSKSKNKSFSQKITQQTLNSYTLSATQPPQKPISFTIPNATNTILNNSSYQNSGKATMKKSSTPFRITHQFTKIIKYCWHLTSWIYLNSNSNVNNTMPWQHSILLNQPEQANYYWLHLPKTINNTTSLDHPYIHTDLGNHLDYHWCILHQKNQITTRCLKHDLNVNTLSHSYSKKFKISNPYNEKTPTLPLIIVLPFLSISSCFPSFASIINNQSRTQ